MPTNYPEINAGRRMEMTRTGSTSPLQGLAPPSVRSLLWLDDEAITMVRTGRSISGHPQLLVDIRPAEPEPDAEMEP